MTIQNPIQAVATDLCVDDSVCGPQSIEASLSCSPIGWSIDTVGGWIWKYGIAQVTFWNYCSSTSTYSLSAWLPASITFQLCPLPNAQNQEPNPYVWHSKWAYFGGVAAGTCSNQYRIRCDFVPIAYNQVNASFVVQALNRVNGENVWQGYTSWAADCTEIPPRSSRYASRGYAPSAQYTPISTSQVGGKGDVTHVSFVVGVTPFLEYCGEPCKLFNGQSFQGCANAVVYSKTNPLITDLLVNSNTNYDVTIINPTESYTFTNTDADNSISFITNGGLTCIKISVTNNDALLNVNISVPGYFNQTVLPGETFVQALVVASGTTFTVSGTGITAGLIIGSIFKSVDCNDDYPPYAFVMGRNPNPCGSNVTTYCLCDQIVLTSTSPVEGETVNNEWEGPNKNDFVQVFGYGTGMSGQVVGAVQQFQIGVAQGQYLVMANVNEGPLQFGTLDVATNTWIWGGAQKVSQGNPTVYFVDRPDRYYYIYTFEFPNQDILPSCTNSTTTPYPELPTTTTAYPFPQTTTTTTSTTCAPSFAAMLAPMTTTTTPEPVQPSQQFLVRRAALGNRRPCNCGGSRGLPRPS